MNSVAYLPQSKRLLDQVREVLRYKHYSLKTEQAYLYWVRFFVRWHGRDGKMQHPSGMGATEVTQFLTMLANEAIVRQLGQLGSDPNYLTNYPTARSVLCVPRWLLTNAESHSFGVSQQCRTDRFSTGRPIDSLNWLLKSKDRLWAPVQVLPEESHRLVLHLC